jgi:hypothetical protein
MSMDLVGFNGTDPVGEAIEFNSATWDTLCGYCRNLRPASPGGSSIRRHPRRLSRTWGRRRRKLGVELLRAIDADPVQYGPGDYYGTSRVHVSENPWSIAHPDGQPARGHYLAVATQPSGLVVAQVSLFLRIRYVVHLMTTCLVTATPMIASAHFFDVDAMKASRVAVPPLVPGPALRVAEGGDG